MEERKYVNKICMQNDQIKVNKRRSCLIYIYNKHMHDTLPYVPEALIPDVAFGHF